MTQSTTASASSTVVGGLSQDRLDTLLKGLADRDDRVARALNIAGFPKARLRPHSFETLLSVIASQQLSVKAAATIFGRLKALMQDDPTPEKLEALSDDDLRGAGLSRPKVSYARSLAHHVLSGQLDLSRLPEKDTEDVVKELTAVKGLGRWSAEMYLISSLGREDIWPVDDLGVQEGIARILGLDTRPTPKELSALGETWRPARTAMAILAWHYYAAVPL